MKKVILAAALLGLAQIGLAQKTTYSIFFTDTVDVIAVNAPGPDLVWSGIGTAKAKVKDGEIFELAAIRRKDGARVDFDLEPTENKKERICIQF